MLKKVRHETCDPRFLLAYIWNEILLKKVRHEMCDPWFLPACIWNKILLKKVWHEKCDPWCWKKGMVVTQFRNDFFIMILRIFYEFRNFMNTCSQQQQEQQLHESPVNRLYECKPVKIHSLILKMHCKNFLRYRKCWFRNWAYIASRL